MSKNFVSIDGTNFIYEGKPFMIKGFGLGSFLNIEHFMLKLVGIEQNIRKAFIDVYGEEGAKIFWKNFENAYFNKKDGQFLKEIGVNTIRLPFNYHLFYNDEEDCFNEEGFSSLDRVIKICEENGIFVILDLHATPGGQNPDWHSDNLTGESLFWHYGAFQKRVIDLWRMISERYKDNSTILGYDVLNEPVIEDRKISGKIVNNFYKKLVANIREIDKNHIIFLEGDFYASDTKSFEILEYDKIAYSIHFYPFFFVEKNLKKYLKMNREERLKFFYSILKNIVEDIKIRLGKPVWCGETGIPYRLKYIGLLEDLLDETLEFFEREKISWSIWTYKDAGAMGALFIDENSEWSKMSESINDKDFLTEFSDFERKTELYIKKSFRYKSPSFELIRKVKFRLLSINDLIMIEKLKEFLRKVPLDKIIYYPDAFLFEKTKRWKKLIDIIKKWL